MSKEKIKVYLYTRVSTAMQIDGYSLIDGKLEVNEEEAVAIRTIFDQYVNTDLGANGIAKYLENHGIHKIARQNGTNPLFDAIVIRIRMDLPILIPIWVVNALSVRKWCGYMIFRFGV